MLAYFVCCVFQVYDHRIHITSLVGAFCGTVPPPMIRSITNILYVQLKSNRHGNFSGAGFTASYSIVNGTIANQMPS